MRELENENLDKPKDKFELQRRIREMQIEHQDEILRYKGKLTTMEYELRNKNSHIEVITNKLKKTEQELDIVR